MRLELGWKPEIGFSDAIKKTVEWYMKNKHWWQDLIYPFVTESHQWKSHDYSSVSQND
jgi:dTDP-D-glucose 4,6-dehydratase